MVRTALLTLWLLRSARRPRSPHPGQDGGEGTWGLTNDRVVTNAGFFIIAGFPVLIAILSIAYDRLEKRRLRRWNAAKARRARADIRGGW